MSENEDIDELLYTQEDINEWMSACDELQEILLDKKRRNRRPTTATRPAKSTN